MSSHLIEFVHFQMEKWAGMNFSLVKCFVPEHLACEQALLFGRVKRVSRERASERRSREGPAFSRSSLRLPKKESLLAGYRALEINTACLTSQADLNASILYKILYKYNWSEKLVDRPHQTQGSSDLHPNMVSTPLLPLKGSEICKWSSRFETRLENFERD